MDSNNPTTDDTPADNHHDGFVSTSGWLPNGEHQGGWWRKPRFWLILLTLLFIMLVASIGYYFWSHKRIQADQVDKTTLCLLAGAPQGLVAIIDQTTGIDKKRANGITRRLKKISSDELQRFARITLYRLDQQSQLHLVGVVCSPGDLTQIDSDWAKSFGMTGAQIINNYTNRLDQLIASTTITAPATPPKKIYLMAGLKTGITLYRQPSNDSNGNLTPAPPLDWLVLFSPLEEVDDQFSSRDLKTMPSIAEFWGNHDSLKSNLDKVAVGIYYFKPAQSPDKKNTKQTRDKNKKPRQFKKFWQDYWQSQSADMVWWRDME